MSRYTTMVCDQCGDELNEYEAFTNGGWQSLEATTRVGKMHADFCSDACKALFERVQLPRLTEKAPSS